MSFVYDNAALDTALYATKVEVKPVQSAVNQIGEDDLNNIRTALGDIRTVLQDHVVSALAYGAVGDGTTDDSAAIQAALTAVATVSVNGAYGGIVDLPGKRTYMLGSRLLLPNGVGLRSTGGPTAAILRAKSTFSNSALIANVNQDGTQEFAFLEGLQIDGAQASGAVCSTAVVDFGSIFINSWIRDCVILNGSNVGLRIGAAGTPGGMGPILVENVWVANCLGDGIVGEEDVTNTGACAGIYFNHVTSENQGANKAAIRLTGLGHATQWHLKNIHIEMGTATNRIGIKLDGVSHCLIDGVQLLRGGGSATAGIQITNVVSNVGIQIRGVTNENLIDPVLSDLKNSVTIGAVNVPNYVTADVTWRGAPRYLPDSTTGAKSVAFQSSAGVDRAWFDDLGQLTGNSLNGAGLDVVGDVTNDRPLALINHAKNRVFAWFYPDASNLRFRYFTGGLDLINFASDASCFIYGTSTLQLNCTMQSGLSVAREVKFTGEITPAQITANQDNYSPTGMSTATWLILTSDASRDITGFATGAAGRVIWVYNNGAQNIVLKHQVTSTATNQIVGRGAADTTLTPKTGAQLYYSASVTKWLIVGDTL